jgi:RHS repeat-associated protein
VRTAPFVNDDSRRVQHFNATLPGGEILTMTHRFDNLLSSKTGPLGTQALLWDGQNVATATGPASVGTNPPASAVFVGTDTTTQGNWKTVYGSDGYNIIQDAFSYPSYATVSETGANDNIWTSSTTDVRALEYPPPGTSRIAAGQARVARRCRSKQVMVQLVAPNGYIWYNNTTFTVNVDLTDGKPHQVAIYSFGEALLARRYRSQFLVAELSAPNGYIWDEVGRTGTVSVVDANSGVVLNTQNLSSYENGIYLIWTITGSVQLVFTNTEAHENAVVSGLFFDPPIAKCLFIGTDTTTQGNWQGAYGADGYNIIEDAVSYPSYATVSETGTGNFTWTSSTTDVRALEQVVTGRIAACWYSDSNFTVDINFTDGNAHKLSAYFLDWDEAGRTETVQIKDARTQDVLFTQSLSSFQNGQYLAWTITGHVQLVVTNTNDEENGVISGLFFDTEPVPTGGYGMIAMGAGLTRSVGVDANGNPVVRQYHMDSLGSVVAITDGSGNLVTNYQIDAWGNVLSGSSPGNAFDFLGGLGYWADPDLGLHYVRARWMNPQFGNWLSVDPHLDEFAYQYANNMPTTSTDASGKDPELDRAIAIWDSGDIRHITVDQIGLLLRADSAHKLPKALTYADRRVLEGLMKSRLAARSSQSSEAAQDPNAPRQGGAPRQTRSTQPQAGHPGAPAGQGTASHPRGPVELTQAERDLLKAANIDFAHPNNPAERRFIEEIGTLNARHVGIDDPRDTVAIQLRDALAHYHGQVTTQGAGLGSGVGKHDHSSIPVHLPTPVQHPHVEVAPPLPPGANPDTRMENMRRGLLGMTHKEHLALQAAGITDSQISQTVGFAPLSRKSHYPAGVVIDGHFYPERAGGQRGTVADIGLRTGTDIGATKGRSGLWLVPPSGRHILESHTLDLTRNKDFVVSGVVKRDGTKIAQYYPHDYEMYGGTVDISLRDPGRRHKVQGKWVVPYKPDNEIETMLNNLMNHGFIAYYRKWGTNNHHIHAVYAGVPLATVAENQVGGFLLPSDKDKKWAHMRSMGDTFTNYPPLDKHGKRLPGYLPPTDAQRRAIWALFTDPTNHNAAAWAHPLSDLGVK